MFLQSFHLVDKCAVVVEIYSAALARFQSEGCVKACLLLVAIDNDVGTRLDGFAGQCPGILRVILVGDGIGIEIYGCCAAVVELYP